MFTFPRKYAGLSRSRGLLLSLALTLSAPAWATRTECEKALLAIQGAFGETIKTENFNEVIPKGNVNPPPTVVTESKMPGKYGGQRVLLRKVGSRWASAHTSNDFDPQGDPRWFIELLGVQAARFFGYEIIDDDRVLVPDGVEFAGALKEVNRQLRAMGKEEIEITFFSPGHNEILKPREYLTEFGMRSALPIAESGNHLIHDVSFHVSAIFYPSSLVKRKAFYVRYLLGFIDFLKKRYEHEPAKRQAVGQYAKLLLMNEAVGIDAASGLVGASIISSLRDPGSKETFHDMYKPILFITSEGKTVISYFSEKIYALDFNSPDFKLEFPFADVQELFRSFKALSLAQLDDDLTDFNTQATTPGHQEHAGRSVPPSEITYDEICKGISLRRMIIMQAVKAIQTKAQGTKSR